jgi:hypothetical protein
MSHSHAVCVLSPRFTKAPEIPGAFCFSGALVLLTSSAIAHSPIRAGTGYLATAPARLTFPIGKFSSISRRPGSYVPDRDNFVPGV